jgi:hypothetical protein
MRRSEVPKGLTGRPARPQPFGSREVEHLSRTRCAIAPDDVWGHPSYNIRRDDHQALQTMYTVEMAPGPQ